MQLPICLPAYSEEFPLVHTIVIAIYLLAFFLQFQYQIRGQTNFLRKLENSV